MENFIETFTKEEANKIDLDEYTFIRFSDNRGYIFKRRAKKNKP